MIRWRMTRRQTAFIAGVYIMLALYMTGIPQQTILRGTRTIHSYGPAAGGAPDSVVVMLHSSSADGADILSLAPAMAAYMPHTLFIAPDGIVPSRHVPFYFSWFDKRWGDGKPAVRRLLPPAVSYVDGLVMAQAHRHDLPPRRIALFGFSQGAVTALHAGPQLEYELAGIAALAGYVAGDMRDARQRPPVFLSHGADDRKIAFSEMAATRAALTDAGFEVTAFAAPGVGHEVGGTQVARAAAFLAASLDNARARE